MSPPATSSPTPHTLRSASLWPPGRESPTGKMPAVLPNPGRQPIVSLTSEELLEHLDRPTPIYSESPPAIAAAPPKRAALVRLDGASAGLPIALDRGTTRIGRSREADPAHRRRQREPDARLARIRRDGARPRGSRLPDGTTVRGERVTRRPLLDGDVFRLGPGVTFRFSVVRRGARGAPGGLYESSDARRPDRRPTTASTSTSGWPPRSAYAPGTRRSSR